MHLIHPTRIIAALLLLSSAALPDDFPYHKPPKEMLDALTAPLTPTVSLSPQRDTVLILQPRIRHSSTRAWRKAERTIAR